MKVLKFGGTSVGKPERMHSIAKLISDNDSKIVVLSAVSGTTNALVDISNKFTEGNKEAGLQAIEALFKPQYDDFVENLYTTETGKAKGKEIISYHYNNLKSYAEKPFGEKETKEVLAEGELISTKLFQEYLSEQGYNSKLLFALEFMKTDADHEPVISFIEEKVTEQLKSNAGVQIFITQGYICRNSDGEIDNLKRGGSDYSATLIGAAIRAEEIQIWTDIDGMHNNDPRVVKRTFPIPEVSFDEAAELAYFGAKILHPTCIRPAHERKVPVRLLNTMQPEQRGTVITSKPSERDFTAISAKDDITTIKIKSTRMFMAYGFLRKIFEIFEKYKTPVDMITTSEVGVSLTIDDNKNLTKIVEELKEFSSVEVEQQQTIVCVVGSFGQNKSGIAGKIFEALAAIPVKMISYGGSSYNISVVISHTHKAEALNLLNEALFYPELVK
jgi:aspartate kinase